MSITVARIAAELADREAIKDCLFRYSRGIDRADAELLRSVYWPGAMDYHTGFSGTAEEFIDWSMPRLAVLQDKVHMLGNIFIRLEGDRAKAETYFWSVSVVPGDEPRQVLASGRYLDKFEKRSDEWRIAERFVVHDWFNENAQVGDWSAGPFGMAGLERGAQLVEDKSSTWLGLGRQPRSDFSCTRSSPFREANGGGGIRESQCRRGLRGLPLHHDTCGVAVPLPICAAHKWGGSPASITPEPP